MNQLDADLRTPLHGAAALGHAGLCAFFLKRGADVRKIDNKGRTPLHVAEEKGYVELCILLLAVADRTGDFTSTRRPDSLGLTLIDIARQYKHAACVHSLLLFESTKQMGSRPSCLEDAKLCELLIDTGVDIQAVDSNGPRPFTSLLHSTKAQTCVCYY